ncbi:uncharacterized protein BT62DRAFT_989601 [Guyanagaster necrorhizus]|uniref:Uncharacterized protein n=1 Tax=Guyanagaster necrorhizus TaxID=856835 RepID=A0A9P8ALT8_9AGAR|nr:uncharacterized protein BT62DRAFT_989601 [Guyanagaster necrorhizus MCA 3950]KAG7439177.1 hypothetical protein BT62DRAFT_989601 [Guyanagaster necrorhizus MCA 3950]
MSRSPPIHRFSSSSSKEQQDLFNACEAEEERRINLLSRKLEKLREEKIELENTLEAESESHVNRLSRQLTAALLGQHENGASSSTPGRAAALLSDPSVETILESLRRENEQLRNRLVDTERDFIRVSRLNDIYREELIEHRMRLGVPVDNLVGLHSADPFSQPIHRKPSYSQTSPSNSVLHIPTHRPSTQIPIARPSSIRRVNTNPSSSEQLSEAQSPESPESPYPPSPLMSTNNASVVSNNTNMTSPPTSLSVNPAATFATPSRGLSYPSVPPPSLSSSFGSPVVTYHRDHSLSPVEPLSRRSSSARRGSYDWQTGPSRSRSHSRRASVERGGRVAETGTLVPRSRADSHNLPATTEGDEIFAVEP